MKRRGFTIVELMVVVGVIATLLSFAVSTAMDSIKSSRRQRAAALCAVVQSGLATYYAQKDEWPGSLGGKVKSGSFSSSNNEGVNGQTDPDKYVLTAAEVREVVKALVDEAKRGNPMLDVSGLFVSRDAGEKNGRGLGMDFMSAIHGTRQSRKKMTSSEMYFGYPEYSHGYFRRFKMVYSIPGDSIVVTVQDQDAKALKMD